MVLPQWPQWTVAVWVLLWTTISALTDEMEGNMLSITKGLYLKEDAKQSRNFPVEIVSLGNGNQVLTQEDGTKYDLANLEPYVDLFSDKYFRASADKTEVIDIRTGASTPVTIFRANYDDGSTLLVEKGEKDGKIVYAEIRRPRGVPDLLLLPDIDGGSGTGNEKFMSFTPEDIDVDFLNSKFSYGEVESPTEDEPDNDRLLRSVKRKSLDQDSFDGYPQARGGFSTATWSTTCSTFQVVNLAVVFDSDFCAIFGDFEQARRRILTIVASASFHYERDMCVKLSLTNIITPERSCSAAVGSSFFSTFNRSTPCGSDNKSFLSLFASWMRQYRRSLKIDKDSVVHMFSGYDPPYGTIGCAYVGSFCSRSFDYGLEYMSFSTNTFQQGVVLAHEVGHNLKASHLSSRTRNYIMEPAISNAADGFSSYSIARILSFLNSGGVTCDDIVDNKPSIPEPTSEPTPEPTPRLTGTPTHYPTHYPTLSPTHYPTLSPPLAPVSKKPVSAPTSPPVDEEDGCQLNQNTREEVCIFASSQEGRYACIDRSLLLNARASPSCLFPTPRTRILRCDGRLRSGRILEDDEGAPSLFETETCKATCVVVSNYICFLASAPGEQYSITYSAIADFDVSTRFTTDVLVKADDGAEACYVAMTSCGTE